MKKKKQIKNKIDVLNILFFIFLFILGASMSFASSYYTYEEKQAREEGNITAVTHNLVISYEGLTKDEINKANLYINDIDPIYLTERQKEIRFVKNITSYCSDCVGLNYHDGDLMVILYRESETETKYTLCHEAIHSYIYGDDDVEEPMVREIAETMVCFKHKGKSIW